MTDLENSPSSNLLRALYQRSFEELKKWAPLVPQEDRMLVWQEVFGQESVVPTLILNELWKDAQSAYNQLAQEGRATFLLPGHVRVLENAPASELAEELLGKNFFLSFQQLLEAMEWRGDVDLTVSVEHEEKYLQFLAHRWYQNNLKDISLFDVAPFSSTSFLEDKWEKLCAFAQEKVDEILNDPYSTYQHEEAKVFGAEITKRLLLSQASEGVKVKSKKM